MRSADQSGTVARRGPGMRRPRPASLTIGKIASQDGKPASGKGVGQRDEERRRAIATRAVREGEPANRGRRRAVKKSADGRLAGRHVFEWLAR
jgi:hypothetical protein